MWELFMGAAVMSHSISQLSVNTCTLFTSSSGDTWELITEPVTCLFLFCFFCFFLWNFPVSSNSSQIAVTSVPWIGCLYYILVRRHYWDGEKNRETYEIYKKCFLSVDIYLPLLCLQVRAHQWACPAWLTLPNHVTPSSHSAAKPLIRFKVKRAWETRSAAKTLLPHPHHQVKPLKTLPRVLQTSVL